MVIFSELNTENEPLSHCVIGVGHDLHEVLPWPIPIIGIVVAFFNEVLDCRFVGGTKFLHALILTEIPAWPQEQ